jgi:LmbE family N-acetylglucosaminyl deacetylase
MTTNPFYKPDLTTGKRILAVQPHYDDNDIAVGGTLTSLVENRVELYYLTVTNDLIGVVDINLMDEAATERLKAEQSQAGEIVGEKEQFWIGYPDAGQYDYFELRMGIIQHIRMLKPDFII